MKVLLLLGKWTKEGRKEKGDKQDNVVKVVKRNYGDINVYNGGDTNELARIIGNENYYDLIFWFVEDIDDKKVIYSIKQNNAKTILIVYEKVENELFVASLNKVFKIKINILIQNNNGKYTTTDPLGNIWYEGNNIVDAIQASIDRTEFLNSITRESTIQADEQVGSLAWYFNQFKQDFIKDDEITKEKVEEEKLISVVKRYAHIFTRETAHSNEVDKILENSAMRCIKGMPSFRKNNIIFVSKRTVEHKYIENDDFIPMINRGGKLYYQGKFKPAVDSPIHIKLYEHFPNINYIIHSHCYIDGAVFTSKNYPCGAIEEVSEILKTVKKHYNTFDNNFYMINLIGHGSYVLGNSVKYLENINYIGRKIPEKIY